MTWTGIFLGVDLEAWIKLFEGWRGGKYGLKTWKEYDVCNGNVYIYIFIICNHDNTDLTGL